ncbi:MAG: hypothetical protein ACRD34_00235, partial [Bryobacteraceae bacterium]
MIQTYKFGTGSLYAAKTGPGAGPFTPIGFGALQDVSVAFEGTIKPLHGQQIYPLANALAQGKVTGKASWAQVNGQAYNDLFFNGTLTSGSGISVAVNEAATVPAATPWTVVVANGALFSEDLGVKYLNGGNPLTKVTGTPTAAGQYAVNATTGTYTFDTADASAPVVISYTYTNTVGMTIKMTNQLQGAAPTFAIWFATTYNGQQAMFKLMACSASKLSMP